MVAPAPVPFLAYAGMPYHSRGVSWGAFAVTMAWIFSPMARSESSMSAILARTAASGSTVADFSSLARSFMASRSAVVKPS
jgi:hypothetical protein